MAILSSIGGKLFNATFGSVSLLCCCNQSSECTNCCTVNTFGVLQTGATGYCYMYKDPTNSCISNPVGFYDGTFKFNYNPQNYTSTPTISVFLCSGHKESDSLQYDFGPSYAYQIEEAKLYSTTSYERPNVHLCYSPCERYTSDATTTGTIYYKYLSSGNINNNSVDFIRTTFQTRLGLIQKYFDCSGLNFNGKTISRSTPFFYACTGGTFETRCMAWSLDNNLKIQDKHAIWGGMDLYLKLNNTSWEPPTIFKMTFFFVYQPLLGYLHYFINCGESCSHCGNAIIVNNIKPNNTIVNSISLTPILSGFCINGYNINMNVDQEFKWNPTSLTIGKYNYDINYNFRVSSGIFPCASNIGELA